MIKIALIVFKPLNEYSCVTAGFIGGRGRFFLFCRCLRTWSSFVLSWVWACVLLLVGFRGGRQITCFRYCVAVFSLGGMRLVGTLSRNRYVWSVVVLQRDTGGGEYHS